MSLSPSNPLYRIDIPRKSHENSDCAPYGLQEPSRDPPAIRTVASAPTSRCSMKCTGHVSRWVAKTAKTSHELKHLRWNYVEPFGIWEIIPIDPCMLYIYIYMVTFTMNIPQMLAYIPYMDPMGYDHCLSCFVNFSNKNPMMNNGLSGISASCLVTSSGNGRTPISIALNHKRHEFL